MNEAYKSTRVYLKRLSPNHAEIYIKSFNFPAQYEKVLYYLYVKKMPDIIQVKYKLEDEKIFISDYKINEIHL